MLKFFYILFPLWEKVLLSVICYFKNFGFHSRWSAFWNTWNYLSVCQNSLIAKVISNISLSQCFVSTSARPGAACVWGRWGHCSVYALLSGTIWEHGSWLAAEWWVPSLESGHTLEQDNLFFLRPLNLVLKNITKQWKFYAVINKLVFWLTKNHKLENLIFPTWLSWVLHRMKATVFMTAARIQSGLRGGKKIIEMFISLQHRWRFEIKKY